MSGTAIGEHGGSLQIPIGALNAAVTGDTAVAIPFAAYVVRRLTIYGASANLGATTAAVDLRTAVAGGGSAIVAGAVLTGLTGSTIVVDPALAITTVQTASTLYFRVVQGVAPVAGTISAVIEVQPLP